MKRKASIFLALIFLTFVTYSQAKAQKILNGHKTQWIVQAQSDLQKAYADPGLSENERLKLIKESTFKLKEYGQAAMPPPKNLPLRDFMESNYPKKQEESRASFNKDFLIEFDILASKNRNL